MKLFRGGLATFTLLLLTPWLTAQPATQPGSAASGERGENVPDFQVRPGYRVTVAVPKGKLRHARFMAFDDRGTLYVSQKKYDNIKALRDEDGDGVYERVETFLKDQDEVHGLNYRDGRLWFSTPHTIGWARDTNGDLRADETKMVIQDLAGGGGHDWRSLRVTDQYIFTSIGDSGNVSSPDPGRQRMFRFRKDGTDKTEWVTGIRNTEEIHFRPQPGQGMTDELWGVDHGSDRYGQAFGEEKGRQPITDRYPPDEFNQYRRGKFYGHPYLIGDRIPRMKWVSDGGVDLVKQAARTVTPEWSFGAHWAGNGWTFISLGNPHLPRDQRGDAYIAFHGSWNRTNRAGYRVQRVLFDPVTGDPYGSLRIVGTLGKNDKRLARPADVVEAPNGTLLFSSDHPDNKIYRIEHIQ